MLNWDHIPFIPTLLHSDNHNIITWITNDYLDHHRSHHLDNHRIITLRSSRYYLDHHKDHDSLLGSLWVTALWITIGTTVYYHRVAYGSLLCRSSEESLLWITIQFKTRSSFNLWELLKSELAYLTKQHQPIFHHPILHSILIPFFIILLQFNHIADYCNT